MGLMTPRSQNRNLETSTVSRDAAISCHDSVIVSPSCCDNQELSYHQNRLSRLDKSPRTGVVTVTPPPTSRTWKTLIVRSLVYAMILAGAGCGQAGAPEYTEAEKKAQLDKLLAATPPEPVDTPEQIRDKEKKVEEGLPRVVAMLEEIKTNSGRVDEVVELSMSLVALAPKHRAANVAYCKAQLASFFAKESNDHYKALIAINSAAREIERFQEIFDDMSEEERQLFQEVYFNQARREGYYPDGENAPEVFKTAIENLMKMGFRDEERLRAEPKFAGFFTDPKFAPALEAALAQIKSPAADNQPK